MQNLNYFFGTALGVYLIAVVYHGNADKLVSIIGEQKEFAKWAAALAVLMFFEKQSKSQAVSALVYMAIVAMLLTAAENQTLETAVNQLNTIFEG